MEATTHPRSLSRVLPLYFVIFFGFVGYSLMITIYTPLLMHSQLAHRTIVLGVLLALYPFGQFLGSPVIGALSDKYGRKLCLMVSLLVSAVMYVGIALSLRWFHLELLMLFCFVAGLFESNIAIAMGAIADVAEGADRTRLFGYITLSASAAYILGPLVGGKLADNTLVSWFNNALPFWVVAVLLMLMVIYCQVAYKETHKANLRKQTHWLAAFTNIAHVFHSKALRRIYAVNFLLYLAIFGFFRCYPMYIVDEFSLNVASESNYIAWVSVPLILVSLFITGRLAKRYNPRRVMAVSAVFIALTLVVIILPSQQDWLWLTLFLAGTAVAVCMPTVASFISHQVEANVQGQVMGNNQAVQVAAESLSGLFGGLIAAISISLPMVILASAAIAAVILLCTVKE